MSKVFKWRLWLESTEAFKKRYWLIRVCHKLKHLRKRPRVILCVCVCVRALCVSECAWREEWQRKERSFEQKASQQTCWYFYRQKKPTVQFSCMPHHRQLVLLAAGGKKGNKKKLRVATYEEMERKKDPKNVTELTRAGFKRLKVVVTRSELKMKNQLLQGGEKSKNKCKATSRTLFIRETWPLLLFS